MKHRIAFAAIVGLIGLSVLSPALASKSKRPAPERVSATLGPDEAFVAAHDAFTKNDSDRFEKAAAQARTHPLANYLEFWRLRLRLQAPEAVAAPGIADAPIRSFVERNADTLVADLMRRHWMLDLGRRAAWESFDVEYAKWVLRDDDEVDCYSTLGRVQRGQPAPEARTRVFSVRSFGDGCAALLEAMARTGALTRTDLFERLLVALERNSANDVRTIAAQSGFDTAAVERALARPAKSLESAPPRELALIALARMARSEPEEAIARLPAMAQVLRDEDRAFVWSQIAASGMRRLDARSLEWAQLSAEAPATDETWAWLARAALRAEDWPTLRKFIARMSDARREESAWVYWLARALRATGEPEHAEALLRPLAGKFDFYGMLAAEELGALTSVPPRALAPSDAELDEAARNAGFDRAMRFYRLGLRFEGNREWNFQLRGMDDRRLLAAAQWACRQQVLDRCVNTAERTRTEHDFTLRFVSPFVEQMKPAAAQRELDPAWIYGLIRQESRFISDARSGAGARGLMQIMPATGRWIAQKLGERGHRTEHLNELDTNLRYGTFYLRTVLDDLEGSAVLASAAYNAGPGRPRNWRATLTRPVEGAIFAEIIPFGETRDYVKKVLSNAVFYSALFSGEPQSLKARLGSVAPQAPLPLRSDIP